jgi:hypothetical protein
MHLLLLATLAAAPPVDAPVTNVTVYSDRARVVRTAQVNLSGTQKLELPLLNATVDLSSIRVEAQGAEVKRVDIGPVQDDEFAPDEARKLVTELEKLDDDLARIRAELGEQRLQTAALQRLNPMVPSGEPLKPLPKLNPAGWTAAATFSSEREAKLQTRARELEVKLRELAISRQVLAEKAALLGGARRRSGYRVTATVAANGPAKVQLTYVTAGARWYPSYDLQLVPETGKVQVSFAGLVSQESGEDWDDAALTLSTAIPATSTVAPKLQSWKIGEKERFIPTPAPQVDPVLPPPLAPPLPSAVRDEEVLKARLLALAGGVAAAAGEGRGAATGIIDARDFGGNAKALRGFEFADDSVEGELVRPDADYAKKMKKSEARRERPRPAPPPPPAQPMNMPAPSAAPMAPPPMEVLSADREESVSTKSAFGGLFKSDERAPQPTSEMSLSPPGAYERPSYDPNLPASLAGGYDLAYPSLRPETIKTGKGARRVALFSESWPVTVERKVFPALAKEAFLVAEIKSPSKQVLPGGNANLFVGADPAGTARLGLVSPGEAFTLPLGLDRAIKPVRNVKLVQAEKGLIGKTELTEYVVTIELANPYGYPMSVRILDQWPLTDDKEVEVKLLKTEPWAIQDKDKGGLEWRVVVPASGKSTVSFTYSLRRPKGWRMHQQ